MGKPDVDLVYEWIDKPSVIRMISQLEDDATPDLVGETEMQRACIDLEKRCYIIDRPFGHYGPVFACRELAYSFACFICPIRATKFYSLIEQVELQSVRRDKLFDSWGYRITRMRNRGLDAVEFMDFICLKLSSESLEEGIQKTGTWFLDWVISNGVGESHDLLEELVCMLEGMCLLNNDLDENGRIALSYYRKDPRSVDLKKTIEEYYNVLTCTN